MNKLGYPISQLLVSAMVLFVTSLQTGCTKPQRDLKTIRESGELRILTRNSATTYFEDRNGDSAGFEFDLATRFARHLEVKPNFIVLDSIESLIEALERGKGDLIAGGLTASKKRKEKFDFGPGYQDISQTVVCREGVHPGKITELKGKSLLVESGTSYEERLEQLKKKFPEINYSTTNTYSSAELFAQLAEGKIDCTVADSHIVSIHRRYFPNLEVTIPLGNPQELAWAVRPDSAKLIKEIEKWFESEENSGRLENLRNYYYSHSEDFDPYDLKKFRERIEERLPKYVSLFKNAAKEIEIDWMLLAAISYQESHWNPTAKSPTGVRGMMMLTRPTAKSLGVKNRLDPKESIMGGARYIKRLKEQRIPKYITEPDRTWMTLASYNVGYSHLRDARSVAVWKEHNPNKWTAVKSVLPLLSRKSIYKRLPHGYARGTEPVAYVERIRNYYDILSRQLKN